MKNKAKGTFGRCDKNNNGYLRTGEVMDCLQPSNKTNCFGGTCYWFYYHKCDNLISYDYHLWDNTSTLTLYEWDAFINKLTYHKKLYSK